MVNSLGALWPIQSRYSGCQAALLLCPSKALDRSERTSLLCGQNSDHLHKVRARIWHPSEQCCAGTPTLALSEWVQVLESIQALHMQVWKLQFPHWCSDTASELTWSWSRPAYHGLHCRQISMNCFIFLTQVWFTLRQELGVSNFGVQINHNRKDRQEESNCNVQHCYDRILEFLLNVAFLIYLCYLFPQLESVLLSHGEKHIQKYVCSSITDNLHLCLNTIH